jgi:hypothetical protein
MLSQGNSRSIAQESSKKWTVPPFLQPISFKSDRLLAIGESGSLPVKLPRWAWKNSTSDSDGF